MNILTFWFPYFVRKWWWWWFRRCCIRHFVQRHWILCDFNRKICSPRINCCKPYGTIKFESFLCNYKYITNTCMHKIVYCISEYKHLILFSNWKCQWSHRRIPAKSTEWNRNVKVAVAFRLVYSFRIRNDLIEINFIDDDFNLFNKIEIICFDKIANSLSADTWNSTVTMSLHEFAVNRLRDASDTTKNSCDRNKNLPQPLWLWTLIGTSHTLAGPQLFLFFQVLEEVKLHFNLLLTFRVNNKKGLKVSANLWFSIKMNPIASYYQNIIILLGLINGCIGFIAIFVEIFGPTIEPTMCECMMNYALDRKFHNTHGRNSRK